MLPGTQLTRRVCRSAVKQQVNNRGSWRIVVPSAATMAAPMESAALAELTSAKQLGGDLAAVMESVREYYGETLKSSGDLRTSACTACKPPPPAVRAALGAVPQEVKEKFYGCGNPIPVGIEGLRVLDLGCGSGRDCYVAARLVGEKGSVTGVDMTPSQLEVATTHAEAYCRDTLGYARSNMTFIQGEIEYLDRAGLKDGSADLVISNCVINLSPDKARVLSESYRVLADGGEMHFSDVYCDRRLPAAVRTHPVLLGECLAGSLYINDFIRLCRKVGFTDPRQLECEEIIIHDPELKELVGESRFYSITYRLFKVPGQIEDLCEEYGQVALYKGTIPGLPSAYDLDDHHRFVTNKPMLVCGNTASMVGETWLGPHFTVIATMAAPVESAALAELTSATQLGEDLEAVRESVREYYGETLKSSDDLRTSVCTACKPPPPAVRAALAAVPQEVKEKFYGCGNPIPVGIEGLRVLDLGCGSGRDSYVAARLVGEKGSVTGVDMTPSQLEVATTHAEAYCRDTLGYARCNMTFIQGEIEYLDRAGLEDGSADLIISNCVINLSPDKARALSDAYRVLADGGEMHFSDVYCDRRLPAAVRTHPVLLGECLAGSLYINDFVRLCRKVGFMDPRQLEREEITIHDPELKELVGDARFYGITYRLFKVPGQIEDLCEDYGQVALYKGTIPGLPNAYDLDVHTRFVTNKPMLVCGNTASMVGETWLAPHFTVIGDRAVHFGQFISSAPTATSSPAASAVRGVCCAGGPCA
ncbi:Arsenite methyltransferase, partial [Tetrabaena socialis]